MRGIISTEINIILILTLLFSWSVHGSTGSELYSSATHNECSLVIFPCGNLHPITGIPSEKRTDEICRATRFLRAPLGFSFVFVTAMMGCFFSGCFHRNSIRKRYICLVKKRDFRIEYMHDMDGDKSRNKSNEKRKEK